MSPEASKKTPRTFHCRESLWQKFEQMAQELECSVDYLINDAMKQYARQRGYTASTSAAETAAPVSAAPGALPPPGPPQPSRSASGSHSQSGSSAGIRPVQAQTRSVPALPQQAAPAAPVPAATHAIPPLPPGPAASARSSTAGANPRLPPLPALRSVPPPSRAALPGGGPPPRSVGQPSPPPKGSGTLAVYYKGEFFKVNKDRFVIGRGKQASDLTIKDPNVSRQHAMIEFINGHYFIVDMGSTNGVEFEGQRVQRKLIADGDIFRVCDHELLFVYQ
jgi:neural Wiskott-Aldrich syndrome protein